MRNKSIIEHIATGRFSVLLTLLVVVSLIVTRILAFPHSIPVKTDFGLFTNVLAPLIQNNYVKYGIDGGFLVLFAFLLNHADTRFSINRIRTSLPFFISGIILVTNNQLLGNWGESLSALLILIAISSLFSSYQAPRAEKHAFDISLLLSFASLFWIKSVFLLPVFWIGMYMMKTLSFRSFLASIIGILTPYWFAFFYFAYYNDYTPLLNYLQTGIDFHLINFTEVKLFTWIHLGITILTTMFAIGHCMFSSYNDKIRSQTFLNFLFFILFCTYALIVVDFQHSGSIIYLNYLISTFLISYLYASEKGRFSNFLFQALFITYALIYIWSLS
jgi:hypothetical protein